MQTGRILKLCLLIIVTCQYAAAAQSPVFRGVFVDLQGYPVENVTVSASGANPTISDNFGSFSLLFPDQGVFKPGFLIHLIIRKKDWKVCTSSELEVTLMDGQERNQKLIILCRTDQPDPTLKMIEKLKRSLEAKMDSLAPKITVRLDSFQDALFDFADNDRRWQICMAASFSQLQEQLIDSTTISDNPRDLYRLGWKYFGEKNFDKTNYAWLKAARKGDPDAQGQLGAFYLKGPTQFLDCKEAVKWLKKAAIQDNPTALTNLAALNFNLDACLRNDPDTCLSLLQRAADRGSVRALHLLGIFYLVGPGNFHKEKSKARFYLEKAVLQDYAPAMYELGKLLVDGKFCVNKTRKKYAWYLIRSAADRGVDDAIRYYNKYHDFNHH